MDRWWSVVVRPLWGCYNEPPDAGVGWHLLACCPHAHAPATFFVKRLNISFVLNWLKVEVATVRWVAVCVQVTESTDLPPKNSNRSGRNPGGMMRLCGCLMAILAVSVWIFFVLIMHIWNLHPFFNGSVGRIGRKSCGVKVADPPTGPVCHDRPFRGWRSREKGVHLVRQWIIFASSFGKVIRWKRRDSSITGQLDHAILGVFFERDLQPKYSSDRFAVKSKIVERFKSFRFISRFITFRL